MSDATGLLLQLVVLNHERRVLVQSTDNISQLPQVVVPRYTRLAYAATLASRETYGLDLFVILTADVATTNVSQSNHERLTLLCRPQHLDPHLQQDLTWVDPDLAPISEDQRSALEHILRNLAAHESGSEPGSFGKYCSLDEVRSWYRPYLTGLGLREVGLQQWNSGPWFALFRIAVESIGTSLSTTPKAFWFKAVGDPNTREYAVTKALTEECPYWFPKLVAAKPDWCGWLMEEIDGHELDAEKDGRPWALTARVLAKVQKKFVGQEERLLNLGCRDWRIPRVIEALDPFFEEVEAAMHRQAGEPPRILGRNELRNLKSRCCDLCRRIEDVDIPYTIVHGDFSPHNVIVSNGWPVLIDWAEAYLSFPFISWEYFWNRMIKDHPEQAQWHERMRRNYAYRIWEPLLGRNRVNEGMRLSPAIAVLIHALYDTGSTMQQQSVATDKVRRSLVRRLSREIETLETAGAM